jgi:hypothetical protein
MKANQIFAAMELEHATELFRKVNENSPATFQQATAAACGALKIRPVYMKKQPFEKRVSSVRRALSLIAAGPIAEEMLAVYFLECRKELLVEWLDSTKTEHEDGTLKAEQPPEPAENDLTASVRAFLAADDDRDRNLLLRAFSAQSAVDWPKLDAFLDAQETA